MAYVRLGPDFRDAIVQVGKDALRHGNIEAHLRTSGWRTHGHDHDPRYDGLALHVVWEHDGSSVTTSDGMAVPTVALAGALTAPLPEVLQALAGHRPLAPQGEFPCPGHVPPDRRGPLWSRLADLGEERLRTRADVFESGMVIDGPDQTWYDAMLQALGYRQNTANCRDLARVVPLSVLKDVLPPHAADPSRAEALLLGAAGVLPWQRPRPPTLDAASLAYVERVAAWWTVDRERCVEAPLTWDRWTLAGVRPANHPVRRIASAALLVAPVAAAGLRPYLASLLLSSGERAPTLTAPLQVPSSYWAMHVDIGRRATPAPQALVGSRRMIEIMVNATLPAALALARLSGDSELEAAAVAAFRRLPSLGDNQISRQMLWQILEQETTARTAAEEQGLLHAYHRWCRHKRCSECPVARLVGENVPRRHAAS